VYGRRNRYSLDVLEAMAALGNNRKSPMQELSESDKDATSIDKSFLL